MNIYYLYIHSLNMNKDLYMKIGDVISAFCFCANKNLVIKCSFYFLQIKFKFTEVSFISGYVKCSKMVIKTSAEF